MRRQAQRHVLFFVHLSALAPSHPRRGGLAEHEFALLLSTHQHAHQARARTGAPLRLDDEACALDFLFHDCYALKQIDVNLASVTEYPVR